MEFEDLSTLLNWNDYKDWEWEWGRDWENHLFSKRLHIRKNNKTKKRNLIIRYKRKRGK